MQSKFKKFIDEALETIDSVKQSNFQEWSSDTLLYTQWNWDYQEALAFQELAVEFVRNNKNSKILIFCNHPHCYTYGRGLQKKVSAELVDFDPATSKELSYPVHKIYRGGGLTFHYPGQWVCYPIINLGHPDYTLQKVIDFLLESCKKVLEQEFGFEGIETENELLGLWQKERKLASLGIGIKRFVTYHGLAMNILCDEQLFSDLRKVQPCGISGSTYVTADKINQEVSVGAFHQEFLRRLDLDLD